MTQVRHLHSLYFQIVINVVDVIFVICVFREDLDFFVVFIQFEFFSNVKLRSFFAEIFFLLGSTRHCGVLLKYENRTSLFFKI